MVVIGARKSARQTSLFHLIDDGRTAAYFGARILLEQRGKEDYFQDFVFALECPSVDVHRIETRSGEDELEQSQEMCHKRDTMPTHLEMATVWSHPGSLDATAVLAWGARQDVRGRGSMEGDIPRCNAPKKVPTHVPCSLL